MLQQQLAAMREAERSRPEKTAEAERKIAEAERDEARGQAEKILDEGRRLQALRS